METKQNEVSGLEGLTDLSIVDLKETSVLFLNGGQVRGPREILEKVRKGLLDSRGGEPERLGTLIKKFIVVWQDKRMTDAVDWEDDRRELRTRRPKT